MKNLLIPAFIFIAFLIITGCKKSSSPAAPSNTPTPIASYTDLASVPGGTFTQTDGISSFSHTISAFKIGKYLVTYDLWYKIYQWAILNGYTFADSGLEGSSGNVGAPDAGKYQPVTDINWRDRRSCGAMHTVKKPDYRRVISTQTR